MKYFILGLVLIVAISCGKDNTKLVPLQNCTINPDNTLTCQK